MNSATVLMVVAVVSLSVSIAGGIYIWRRHSYSVRDEHFQVELWRVQKRANQRDRQHQDRRAFR